MSSPIKLTTIDRPACRIIRERMDEALRSVAADLGVVITVGNIKYSGTNAVVKIDVSTVTASGDVLTIEAQDFRRYAVGYGLQSTDLNRSFVSGGRKFVITGLKPRAHRRPIQTRGQDGKTYVWPVTTVKALLVNTPA